MLVERGAVEVGETVRIVREVARKPVEQHGDSGAMAVVDQRLEIGGGTKAAGRCKQAGRLIAPRTVERMLAYGQELDMSKAEVADIAGQLVRQLPIGEPAAAFVGVAAP